MAEISREEAGNKGRYVLRQGDAEAELTYTILSNTLRSADHAGAPMEMRGQGVGVKLIEQMIADANAEGWKIRPDCPFVALMQKRKPDWADSFAA